MKEVSDESGKRRSRRKVYHLAMVAVVILNALVWYVLWFDYNDCLGALKQIGDPFDPLYQSILGECEEAKERRIPVGIIIMVVGTLTEFALWRLSRRNSEDSHEGSTRP
jgi:hypothetical protein